MIFWFSQVFWHENAFSFNKDDTQNAIYICFRYSDGFDCNGCMSR